MLAEITRTRSPGPLVSPGELEHIALSGQYDLVHGLFRSIPEEKRKDYANKYVLSGVITGGQRKLKKFLSASAESAAMEEKEFIDGVVRFFLADGKRTGSYSRELFESLLQWGSELADLSLLEEASLYYDEVLLCGVRKYPDLFVRALLGKAGILNTAGDFTHSQELLLSLAERPYLLGDRSVVPELMFSLGRESLMKGDVSHYKEVLFRGLRHFSSSMESRRVLVDQLRKTYRRSYRVFLDGRVRRVDRFLFGMHVFYFRVASFRLSGTLGIAALVRKLVLGYLYCLNYMNHAGVAFATPRSAVIKRTGSEGREEPSIRQIRRSKDILITRAMGGIGDLLMMTPGLNALKRMHPNETVFLAIPGRYFPLFQDNPDVTLIDVDDGEIDLSAYRKWYNLSDCPASRVESRTAPKVKKSRIDIFASGMGISWLRMQGMARTPRYVVSDPEISYRNEFWRRHGLGGGPVVGVQLHSEEAYRDYPHMMEFVQALSRSVHVMAFDSEPTEHPDGGNITWVSGLPLRQAFALVSGCDVIVAPDSAFVHLSAALDIPCVGLYGPIDGEVRTKYYPKCTFIDVREKLGCMPCWRNDQIPCKLTNMRTSACMRDIGIAEVLRSVKRILQETGKL